MSDGIYAALSGAVAQGTVLETVATNLANASTAGYQRLRPVFHEVLSGARAGAGAQPPLHYATISATALDTTQGALRQTGRGLDVAMPEGTYLAVQTPRGERYTRAGALTVATDGTLTTTQGAVPVLGEDGHPIVAHDRVTEVTLGADGSVTQAGSALGRLRLVSFAQPEQLTHEGGSLLNAPTGAGAPTISQAPLVTGALEESNTSVVGAMTDLVTASRTFEAFQRAIQAFGDADHKVMSVSGDT